MSPFLEQLSWIVLAIFGGITRYLDGIAAADAKINVTKLATNAFISGFCGYMAAYSLSRVDQTWTVVAAGLGGYLGTQVLDILRDALKSKLPGQKKDD